MPKKPDPIESWNLVIKSLLETKKAWKTHLEVMETRPNIEALPIEAQNHLRYAIHRSPTFERFLEGFMGHWIRSGGLTELIISQEEEVKPKTKIKGKE